MAQADVKEQTRIKVSEPPMFKVIYVNDEVTTVEFVIESLMDVFHYKPDTAEQITWDIHEQGAATVAVLPYELAEQKGAEVLTSARAQQFPLQVRLEPDL